MKKSKVGMKVLTVGVVLGMLLYTGVRAYQKEGTFKPDQDTREIQENHVVFEDNNKNKSNLDDSTGDSDLWQKNKQDQKLDMSQIPDSSVLFEQNKTSEVHKDSKFVDDQRGKKTPVKITQTSSDGSKGTIRVNKEDPSGQPSDPDRPGKNNKTPSDGDGDNGNGDGNQPGNDPDPQPGSSQAPNPVERTTQPEESYRPTMVPPERPTPTVRPTATPTPTAKPKPPEEAPSLPDGDSLIESMYPNVTDFPADGLDERQQKLQLMILPIFNIDRKEYIYYGAELTQEKLLYSVIVYVADENNRVLYRLTQLSDNFKIEDYPEVAEEDFTASFLFRQNTGAQWQTTTYDFTVLPYKFFVLNSAEKSVDEKTPDDGTLNLLSYYNCNLTEEQKSTLQEKNELLLGEIIPGWKDIVEDVMVPDQYQTSEKGWKAFMPAEAQALPQGYEVKLKWYLNLDDFNYCANLKYLQTLTKIPEGVKDLKVMQGIHWVDLGSCELDTMELSASTAVVSTEDTIVREAYQVPEDNAYFTAQDGILFNKEQTKLQGIPLSCRELDVPAEVTQITIPSVNHIQRIDLSTEQPPEMNVENLSNAIIWVPAAAYDTYYAEWADRLPDTVSLVSDGEDSGELTVKDGAVLSKDGTILYRLLDSVKGNYIVPDTVRVIRKDALKQCKELYQIIITPQVEDLEEQSLVCDSLEKVVLLENTVPLNAEGNFVEAGTRVLAQKDVYEQWAEEERPSGLKAAELLLEERSGYISLLEDNSRILLQTPKTLTMFEGDESVCGRLDEIAPGAFGGCKDMIVAVMPQSVKNIDDHAFMDCSGLQGILFQSKDTLSIGMEAFGDCTNMRFVGYNAKKAEFAEGYRPRVISFRPSGSTGYPNTGLVPYNIYQLEHASELFLEGTPEDGFYLYADYKYEGVIDGTYLAAATDNVSGELKLREDTAEIIFYAFNKCKNEFRIDFTQYENLFSIGENAFQNSGLSGEVTLPQSLLYLNPYAFSGCKKITQVNMESDYLNEIPMYAFSGCTSLAQINFNADNAVEQIGAYAFAGTELTSFVISENVHTIYENIFTRCSSLKELYVVGDSPAVLKSADDRKEFSFGQELPEDFQIVVPGRNVGIYRKEWELYADKIVAEQLANRR